MGIKESVAAWYIENWHEKTKDWKYPESRSAVVIGCDPENIGDHIATSLGYSMRVLPLTQMDLDPATEIDNRRFHWQDYDTVVFNNGDTHLDWIEDQHFNNIYRVLRNKLEATMQGTATFVRRTIDNPHIKNIVMIGSMAHRSVLNGSAPYCAASAGLNHFGRCIAWELAPKGYRVFIVNPSNVEGTPMTETTIQGLMDYRGLEREQAEAYWGAVRALPEWLNPGSIGEIVTELVTNNEFRWLSGVPLDLGGGLR